MTKNVKQWIKAAKECQRDPSKTEVLPIVKIADDYFFVDVRMTALRNIDTLEIVKFDSSNKLLRNVLGKAELVA